MGDLTGQSFGRYHILERLGEGGMAVVYKAFDSSLERDVAVKVILPYREHSEGFLKRFAREARALAKLSHPNILKVFDYGEYAGQPFLVMEYVPGGTLAGQLQGRQLPWQPSAQLLSRVARALEAAHAQGIIHRDVKPSNILLASGRDPLLSDFGIAKIIQEDADTASLTATGVGIGTPDYMAPEQGYGRADARADIYALGVIFYEMVTGRRPYQAETPMAVMLKKNTEPLPRPSQFARDLSAAVENVLIKALARDPENRYPTMSAFANALESLVNPNSATFTLPNAASSTAATLEENVPPPRAPENRHKNWIPWAAGIGVLSVCCLVIGTALAWTYIFPPIAPSPTDAPLPTTPPIRTSLASSEVPSLPPPTPTLFIPSDTPVPFIPPTFTPTTPARSPGGEWIAFNSPRDGDQDIYLVDRNGNNLTKLTESSAHDMYPSWSPDGRYLAYQTNAGGDQELAIIEVSTRNVFTLTRNECYDWAPSFSPDGQWLAFYSDCDGNRDIYKIRVNGNDRQQLTFTSGVHNKFPSWSPDGNRITFSSNRSGVYQIYVMSADGGGEVGLAVGCVSYYSPDGAQILYGLDCEIPSDIWLMNANGSDQHAITNGCMCKNATWSPDGSRIVFEVVRANDELSAVFILSLDMPDFSNWELVTDYDVNGNSPVWQP